MTNCMTRKKYLLLTCFFISLFCIFFPSKTFASSNFTTDYHVTYSVSPNGRTHAVLNVTLTNTTTQYYASQYAMQLGFDSLINVTASDPDGPITPQVSKTNDGYTIALQFNKKAVGKGAQLPFTIAFDTDAVAKQYGKIWEINIPGIANGSDFQNFTVSIQVPPSFGKPVYTKPTLPTNDLTFTKEQLGQAGISIAFGSEQYFAFHLMYHLRNDQVFPIQTQIALPMSTNYQTVFLSSINPRPGNVVVDSDGNWLAQYTLLPAQKMDIAVDGKAAIGLTPQQVPITQQEIQQDTAPTHYWQANSDEIRELADTLRTPEAIYSYVVKTLHYDFSRVTDDSSRLGALSALQHPNSAVCLEFTDLFIALARAEKIPAREVDGFAYTENAKQRPLSLVKDILHAWPEYYDMNKKTWVMVDPTWGNTTGGIDYFSTLDFDHFAFVIKGKDSTYPIPAGGYKLAGDVNEKDVDVGFTDSVPDPTYDMLLTSQLPSTAIAGLPLQGNVSVENTNENSIGPQIVYIDSSSLSPNEQTFRLTTIPPFGSATIPVAFDRTPFLTKEHAGFTIRMSDKTTQQTITILPFYLTPIGIGGLVVVILALIILIIARQSRRISVSR